MASSILLFAEPVRSIAWGSIVGGGAYTAIGAAVKYPIRILLVQNFTDASVMMSLDGVNDHFPLYQYSQLIIDISSNKIIDGGFFIPKGQSIFVTQIGAPSLGSVYVSTFYGEEV